MFGAKMNALPATSVCIKFLRVMLVAGLRFFIVNFLTAKVEARFKKISVPGLTLPDLKNISLTFINEPSRMVERYFANEHFSIF